MQEQLDSVVAHHLSTTNVVAILATYFAISIAVSFWRAPRYPTTIPWVGYGKGWLAAILNVFGAFTKSKEWTQQGYNKYSKNEKSFVIPSTLGGNAETVLPRSQMQWMLDQPDSVLSTSAAHYDILPGDYSFVKPIILEDPSYEHVIHKNIARNLNAAIPELNEEICRDVDEMFGTDTQKWKRVNALDAFFKMVPKITNHLLVGEPLCRNEDYLKNMLGFLNDVIRNILLLAFFPKALHSIVGPVAGLAGKYHNWQQSRHSLPVIKQRLGRHGKERGGRPGVRGLATAE